jgi:hypothetical protein
MADAADLKSALREEVWVRVPPSALILHNARHGYTIKPYKIIPPARVIMQQWKLYLIVIPSLFFLLFATMTACSQPPATTINTPASQNTAQFEVGPITFEPPVAVAGDSVTVTAAVNNAGATAGTYSAVFSSDGQQVDTKTISVDAGSSENVSFKLSKTTAGSHQLAIGNSSAVLTVYNWAPYTIQYDESDGSPVGAYVNGELGHIVHFTPPDKAFIIQKIRIFAATKIRDTSELDYPVSIRIWDKDANNLLWGQDVLWRLFLDGSWQEIKVPDVRVNDDFQVEVVTRSYGQSAPIDFASMTGIIPSVITMGDKIVRIPALLGNVQDVVLVGFDYPQSYIDSPANRPETRSGYSYMGKLIDPGQDRLKGIQWLIRVDGEGTPGS